MTSRESPKPSINRNLVRHTTLSLATCHDGRPWSTDLFYASDDDCRLYFISSVTTRHSKYIAANPRVSVSISRQCDDWKDIRGL
ncbi:pyridoxamine 5'-phosphate oxidase family protein [Pseudomonadota bacterium]